MESGEVIGILIGTGTAPGLIYVIYVLAQRIHKTYKEAKAKGFTTLHALNIAIRSLNVKGQNQKGKK